jgi:hypothetical protein
LMDRYLVLNCVRLTNAFPTHGEGYENIAPAEIYLGRKLTWKIDFPVAFGDVCLVSNNVAPLEQKTQKARGLVAIALMPIGNATRDVIFLNIATMRIIVRNKYVIIPTSDMIIKIMKEYNSVPETLAEISEESPATIPETITEISEESPATIPETITEISEKSSIPATIELESFLQRHSSTKYIQTGSDVERDI